MFEDNTELIDTLQSADRLVYLCGAGFSMAIGEHSSSWGNWIRTGASYLEASVRDDIENDLSAGTSSDMIRAAGTMLDGLRNIKKYEDFMASTIGAIRVSQEELMEAAALISRCGDFFATTNYEMTIEAAAGLEPVTYKSPGGILNVISGRAAPKVIHLHGAYNPKLGMDDIVADEKQYDDILAAEGAQFIQNLLSTCPIIVVGCGATVEDPNLSHFLKFAEEHLKLNVPYYYLYCERESAAVVPDGMIPVCYGKDYADLPAFMLRLSMHRMRHRAGLGDICKVNPYLESPQMDTAYSRMHYVSRYTDFIGRKGEWARLNDFLQQDTAFSWWMVTGEAGIGKSRLLLEWTGKLPINWFGFFANTAEERAIDRYKAFKPFADTAIVMDYVAGYEPTCAKIITRLRECFAGMRYKLRILLVERHYEPDKKDWFFALERAFSPAERLIFDDSAYKSGRKKTMLPLEVKALKESEEKQYIVGYVEKYVPELESDELCEKYLTDISQTVGAIYSCYRKLLKELYRRPLYLSIFIEVWIYKSGAVSVQSAYELLECYMEKEEQRWLVRFHDDRSLLYAFLKILALGCAADAVCVSEDCAFYQEQADLVYRFLLSEREAGRKKASWTDLFAYSAPDKDKPGILYYIVQPFYPDIIREFIVMYYTEESEVYAFTKSARHISVIEFAPFLIHAVEDFPDNELFWQMIMLEPDHAQEYWEYYIPLLTLLRELPDHDYIIDRLLDSPKEATDMYGLWEMNLWQRLAVVQGERLDRGEVSSSDYYRRAKRCIDYLNLNLGVKEVMDGAQEVMDAWFVELHNLPDVGRASEYLSMMDQVSEKITDEEAAQITATMCAENHRRMIVHHVNEHNYRAARQDLDVIEQYLRRYPDDEDIGSAFLEAAEDLGFSLCYNKKLRLAGKLIAQVEDYYRNQNNEECAGVLAIMLANLYMNQMELLEQLRLEGSAAEERRQGLEQISDCKAKIGELLAQYPNSKKTVSAYASVTADELMRKCLDHFISDVPEELYEKFKHWHSTWKDSLEIGEAFGKLLFVMIDGMISSPGKEAEVTERLGELKALAYELDPLYEKDGSENELHAYANMLSLVRQVNN